MEIRFILMQKSGVVGPSKTLPLENPDPPITIIYQLARQWAKGQTGHPWDVLAVEMNGDSFTVEQ